MKKIDTYITERLKINKDSSIKYNYHPKDEHELSSLIRKLIKERGLDADLNDIDVSKITDMSHIFSGLNIHNIDISGWNVSNVTNMDFMFRHCTNFNSDLSNWNVSNVTKMRCMFYNCPKFNSDLSRWDVSNVEDMGAMFLGCDSLKKIPDWYKDE